MLFDSFCSDCIPCCQYPCQDKLILEFWAGKDFLDFNACFPWLEKNLENEKKYKKEEKDFHASEGSEGLVVRSIKGLLFK